MIKWYAVKINSEVDFNEVLSILRCTGFRWCFELGIDETYSDFPNIKFIFFGKVRNNLRIEWSPRKKLLLENK